MKKNSLFLLSILASATAFADDSCSDYVLSFKNTTLYDFPSEPDSEISVSPDNTVWIGDSRSQLHALGQTNSPITIQGAATNNINFLGQGSNSKGLFGTSEGWGYLISNTGQILWKKQIAPGDNIQTTGVQTQTGGYILRSARGKFFEFSKNGEFLESLSEIRNSKFKEHKSTSMFSALPNGDLIYSAVKTDGASKTFSTRIVKPDGQVTEYKAPDVVSHAPGIGRTTTDPNGKAHNVAVLFGTGGTLRIVDENGPELTNRKLSCNQGRAFAKLDDNRFIAACFDTLKNKPALVVINTDGSTSKPMHIPSMPSSDFSVFVHPLTGRVNIAAGFEDGYIRTIDPISRTINGEWNDDDSNTTLNKPAVTSNGLLVLRYRSLVELKWQLGSSTKKAARPLDDQCEKKSNKALSTSDSHSS